MINAGWYNPTEKYTNKIEPSPNHLGAYLGAYFKINFI